MTGILVAVLAAVVIARTYFVGQRTNPLPQEVRPRVTAVANVHVLQGPGPSPAYFIEGTKSAVLIDSGLYADAAAIKRQAASRGLDLQRVSHILLTHSHGDHVLGAAHLREITGALVAAGKADAVAIRAGAPWDAFFSTFHMPGVEIHPTIVDVELTGGEVFDLGSAKLVALAVPGHTPGSVAFWLEHEDGTTALFGGDAFTSRTGDLGTYSTYLPPRYGGDAGQYLATLRKLTAGPAPDLLYTGHPVLDRMPRKFEVTPEAFRELLERGIVELVQLQSRYERDGADFLDGQPLEILPGMWYLGDFCGQAVYSLIHDSGQYLFDPPATESDLKLLADQMAVLGLQFENTTGVILTSCGPSRTSGAALLAAMTGCSILAPELGMTVVREACPEASVVSADAGFAAAGLSAKVAPMAGRGTFPTAYLFTWRGKNVLVSGLTPVKMSAASRADLLCDLGEPGASRDDYALSLLAAEELKPDVWLPLVSVFGQNANLYDDDWRATIEANVAVANGTYQEPAPPPGARPAKSSPPDAR